MLANTINITIATVVKTLTRVIEKDGSSVYRLREPLGTLQLTIKQTSYLDSTRKVKVERHTAELIQSLFPVAPNTIPENRKSYTVIENDANTADISLTRAISKGLGDFIIIPINADSLLAGEY